MNKEIIEQKVIELVQNIVADQDVKIQVQDKLLDDVELSSLEVLELFATLEEQFDCVIEERKSRNFVTVKDVIDYICSIKEVTS